MKSAPARAKICGSPGLASSSRNGPNTGSPRASFSFSGLGLMAGRGSSDVAPLAGAAREMLRSAQHSSTRGRGVAPAASAGEAMGILEQFSLKQRVALVTGSSRGLGWAIAQALAEAGAHVVLNGRSVATLEPRAQELATRGLAASISTFDVNDPKGPVDGVAAIAEKHGRLDILVNNAGIVRRALAVDTTDAAWQEVLDTD